MSNGHIPPVRNPGPPDVDWSHAPEGATHFCTRQRLWYAKSPDGAWIYMEPFNEKYGWSWSNLDPKHLKDLVPRPAEPTDSQGKVICPECHGNGFVRDHGIELHKPCATCASSGGVDPAKPEGTSEKAEQAERAETGRPGLLDGDIPELLPSDWLTRSHRERSVHIVALAQKKLDITGDRGKQKLREFLSRQGLKKLTELPDDIFAQSSALVFVALLPVIQYAADINWNRITEITGEQLAKISGTNPVNADFTSSETKAAPPSIPLSVDVTLFAEAINYSLGDVGKAYANLARELENASHEQAAGRLDRRQFPAPGYERLHAVYQDAHHQAAYGKGNERHANDLPFHEQRMQTISQGLNSPDGMAYQVIKKVQEGLQMKDAGARRRELLGALNYLAGIVIFLDDREAGGDV